MEVPIIPSIHRRKTSFWGGGFNLNFTYQIEDTDFAVRRVFYCYSYSYSSEKAKKKYYLSEDTYARCFKTYMHDVSE